MSSAENIYSRKVVAEVTGLPLRVVTYRTQKLFPGRKGFTAQQALDILNYAPRSLNSKESVASLREEMKAILKGE